MSELTPGTEILDARFQILRKIGTGGMGEVYLARQLSLGRNVAVKVLKAEVARTSGMSERFRREGKLLAAVDHSSVVKILDFGEWEHQICLVMEHVEGTPLEALLTKGPMVPDRAVRLLTQLAEGLVAIHAQGIVHRDLNPKNVLVANTLSGESAKLLDFGIARLVEADGPSALTQLGIFVGTPEYASPEQSSGGRIDERSDLYSFGVLSYEMLSGDLPFHGPTPLDYCKQHLTVPPVRLEEVAPHLKDQTRLCDLVMRCLEKDPNLRMASAVDLVARLKQIPEVGDPTLLSDSLILPAPPSASGPRDEQDDEQEALTEMVPIATADAHPTHPETAQTLVRTTSMDGELGQTTPSVAVAKSLGRTPMWAKVRAFLSKLPQETKVFRHAKILATLLILSGMLGLAVLFRGFSGPNPALLEARTLLDAKKPRQALELIEREHPKARGQTARALLALKAETLHRLSRHGLEIEALRDLPPNSPEWFESNVLAGVLEDSVSRDNAPQKAILASLPKAELNDKISLFMTEGNPTVHWAALQFLDGENALGREQLVREYLAFLESADCTVRGTSARRLGELGDVSAEGPLKKVRQTPKTGGLFDEKNCGQQEAAAALAALKKKAQ